MKKIVILISLAFAQNLFAQVYEIEFKNTEVGKKKKPTMTKIYVQGENLRMDASAIAGDNPLVGGGYILCNGKEKNLYLVNPQNKMVLVQGKEALKKMAKGSGGVINFVKTKEVIKTQNYEAQKYLGKTNGKTVAEYGMVPAKTVGMDEKDLNDFLTKNCFSELYNNNLANFPKNMFSVYNKIFLKDNKVFINELVSLKKVTKVKNFFEVPKGYNKLQLPPNMGDFLNKSKATK